MKTSYGLRGRIIPAEIFNNYKESFQDGVFEIAIENNIIEIGYEDALLIDEARIKIGCYVNVKSFELERQLILNLDSSWGKATNGGKITKFSLSETIYKAELQGITMTHIIKGKSRIIKQIDNRSFFQQKEVVDKIYKNSALCSALNYFNEEVVDNNKPLYGIYKAIEALVQEIGKNGEEKLGNLVGESKKYVTDIEQTAQLTRHHKTPAKKVLTDYECKERARNLIIAYIKSIN